MTSVTHSAILRIEAIEINIIMKLNEVTQPSEQALFEAIDAQNDTGLQTEDVVKIIRSADGPWSGPFTLEESNVRLRALAEELGIPFEA